MEAGVGACRRKRCRPPPTALKTLSCPGGGGKEESGGAVRESGVAFKPQRVDVYLSEFVEATTRAANGAPVLVSARRNSFSAGNSMYFQMPSRGAGDEMVPRRLAVAGQPYVSSGTRSLRFSPVVCSPQPLVGGNNTREE